jgi:hypothetical protein
LPSSFALLIADCHNGVHSRNWVVVCGESQIPPRR